MDDLIGSDAAQPRGFDRLLDHLVRGVEIERAAGGQIGLFAEPLDDEAGLLACHVAHRLISERRHRLVDVAAGAVHAAERAMLRTGSATD